MLQTADLTESSLLGEGSVDIREASAWWMQNKLREALVNDRHASSWMLPPVLFGKT